MPPETSDDLGKSYRSHPRFDALRTRVQRYRGTDAPPDFRSEHDSCRQRGTAILLIGVAGAPGMFSFLSNVSDLARCPVPYGATPPDFSKTGPAWRGGADKGAFAGSY